MCVYNVYGCITSFCPDVTCTRRQLHIVLESAFKRGLLCSVFVNKVVEVNDRVFSCDSHDAD